MAIEIKHKKVSEKPDSSDTSLVLPSDWNDTHDIEMAPVTLLGNPTNAVGDAAEIPLGAGLSFVDGALVADITQGEFDTGLDSKVSKAGGTMSGNLTIDKTDAAIELRGDNREWYWQAFENGASPYFRLVDKNAGEEAFRVGTDGSLWCRQLGDINTRIEQRALAFANDRVAAMSFRRTSRGEIAINTARAVRDTPAGSVMTGLNLDSNYTVGIRYDYLQMYDPVRGWVTMQG